jgi:hypothetical protein
VIWTYAKRAGTWFGYFVFVIFGMIALLLFAIQLKINGEVRGKIRSALETRYRGFKVSIEDDDEGPLRQLCYKIEIAKDAVRSTRFVSVNGDSDGGTWGFGKEFSSMKSCKDSYWRG